MRSTHAAGPTDPEAATPGAAAGATDGPSAAAAFACAGLFAAVSVGEGLAPRARWVEHTELGFHLLLLPVVARLDAPGRA